MFLHISLLSDDFSNLRTEALLASQPLDQAEFSGPTGRCVTRKRSMNKNIFNENKKTNLTTDLPLF